MFYYKRWYILPKYASRVSISPNWITEEVSPASCPASPSSVLHTDVRHILTNVIRRATVWWLSTVSRFRSKVVNAADRDICSYTSNFVTGTPLCYSLLRPSASPKSGTECPSAALGGNILERIFSKLAVSEHGGLYSLLWASVRASCSIPLSWLTSVPSFVLV